MDDLTLDDVRAMEAEAARTARHPLIHEEIGECMWCDHRRLCVQLRYAMERAEAATEIADELAQLTNEANDVIVGGAAYTTALRTALQRMLDVYEALMPGVKYIAVKNYAELNDAPIEARRLLKPKT